MPSPATFGFAHGHRHHHLPWCDHDHAQPRGDRLHPGATTARTNYPKAGDIATLKLVSVGNTTDATDNITIMAAWCSLVRHAAMYRLSDRV